MASVHSAVIAREELDVVIGASGTAGYRLFGPAVRGCAWTAIANQDRAVMPGAGVDGSPGRRSVHLLPVLASLAVALQCTPVGVRPGA
jgi:hypothetical protein